MEHRNEAQDNAGLTEAQLAALAMGRRPGTNHRTGYKHREETKRKMSASHKAWCAANPDKVKARGEKVRGANHYNWKGGASEVSTSIRQMTENRKWMDAVVRRDMLCLLCGAETDLEAHHVKPFAEIMKEHGITTREQARQCSALWDLSNGVTLCERCHCKEHGRAYTPSGMGRRKLPKKAREPQVGSRNPNWQGGGIKLVCPQCGIEFVAKRSVAGLRRFCSRGCVNESQRKHL